MGCISLASPTTENVTAMELGMRPSSVTRRRASARSLVCVVVVRREFSAAPPFLHGAREPDGEFFHGPTHSDGIGRGIQRTIRDQLAALDGLEEGVVKISRHACALADAHFQT